MGRHLNKELWFDRIPLASGGIVLRMKRVSAKREKQFPRRYRILFMTTNSAVLTKKVMDDYHVGLAEAWKMVKAMFMDSAYECPDIPAKQPVAYRQWSTKWQDWDYQTNRGDLRADTAVEPLYL